jgi:hypothetical protein
MIVFHSTPLSIIRKWHFAVVFFASIVVSILVLTHPAQAQDWNAGKIIDDYTFTNAWTMNAGQIQAFLNSKVPVCDTNGTQTSEFGGGTRAQWGQANYGQSTFTCLKDYSENGQSAAQIIYNTAQRYQINPQVLIVLLQKEQGLVTDTWPLNIQYRSATGYGCPDSAPCDSQYYGLTNQLDWSGKMFRAIMNNSPTWYTPYVLGNNTIKYNPVVSCGSSVINIQNRATQALYNYTPYQPNTAAIAAPMGATVSCGAYGNINFLRYFNSWFGNTYNIGYAATWTGQSLNPMLNPGDSYTGSMFFTNSGSVPWYDNSSNPVHLATDRPINHSSDFALSDGSWGSDRNRLSFGFNTVYDTNGNAYSSNPHVVQPGESVKFVYTLTVPNGYPAGSYNEFVRPVNEGVGGMATNPPSIWITITVNQVNKATYAGQSGPVSLRGGEQKTAYIDFKNTGNFTWYDNTTAAQHGGTPVRLASVDSSGTDNQSSTLGDDSWGGDHNRPTGVFAAVFDKNGTQYYTNPHVVQPGETARFAFTLTAPDNASATSVRTYYAPVVDGGAGITPVYVGGSLGSAWTDTSIASGAALKPTQTSTSTTMNPLSRTSVTYSFKNTGSTTLTQSSTTLYITDGDASKFSDSSWPGSPAVGMLDQSSLAPGATGTFTVYYTAPAQGGTYTFSVTPIVSGSSVGLGSIQTTISVPSPTYSATYAGQSDYPTIAQGSTTQTILQYKNTGNIPWYDGASASGGIRPVVLATTNAINRSSRFSGDWPGSNRAATVFTAVYKADGSLASNQHVVQPGETARFSFTLTVPASVTPGMYREFFQPIIEGGNPWDIGGVAWTDVTISPASFVATYAGQTNYPTISRGSSASISFLYRNTGTAIWYDVTSVPQGLNPITFSTTNPINHSSPFLPNNRPGTTFTAVYIADGATLSGDQHKVNPGEIVKFTFTLTAPPALSIGMYREYYQPILEGASQWNIGGFSWADVTVN